MDIVKSFQNNDIGVNITIIQENDDILFRRIEENYLTSVCKLSDATIDSQCPPTIEDRDEINDVVKDPNTNEPLPAGVYTLNIVNVTCTLLYGKETGYQFIMDRNNNVKNYAAACGQ